MAEPVRARRLTDQEGRGQAGERRAVLHARERILGQSDRGAVRSGTHLCHGRPGPPESPRAGPQAAGLPALA
jgi:hypothetical protein